MIVRNNSTTKGWQVGSTFLDPGSTKECEDRYYDDISSNSDLTVTSVAPSDLGKHHDTGPVMYDVNPVTGGISFSRDIDNTVSRIADTNMKVRPGSVVLPVTTSVTSGGWNVSSDAVLSAGAITAGGNQFMRVTNPAPASQSYAMLRRKIPASTIDLANGKIEIPVYVPPGMGSGAAISVILSSDSPAADPPTVGATNKMTWVFNQSQFHKGQVQILSIDPSATADTSQNIPESVVWTTSGVAPDPFASLQIAIYCPIPANSADPYFEFGPIAFGGYTTPNVFFWFDGAGTDSAHIKYVLPYLAKYGLKACFSVQGQIPIQSAQYANNIKRLSAAGHDIANEGLNHTAYGASSANAALLMSDVATAISNFASIGVTRGPSTIFAAPQNTLYPGTSPKLPSAAPLYAGISDLAAAGFKVVRYGNKVGFAASPLCPECPAAFGGVTCDLATYATMKKYLDAAELHGESVNFLFHAVTAPGGTASGLQCKYEEFTALVDDVAARIAAGRAVNQSPTEFIASYQRATGFAL